MFNKILARLGMSSLGTFLYNKPVLDCYTDLMKESYAKLNTYPAVVVRALSVPAAVIDLSLYTSMEVVVATDSLFRSLGNLVGAGLGWEGCFLFRSLELLEDSFVRSQFFFNFCFTEYGRYFLITKLAYQVLHISYNANTCVPLCSMQGWSEKDDNLPIAGKAISKSFSVPTHAKVHEFIRCAYQINLQESSPLRARMCAPVIAFLDVSLQGTMDVCKAAHCSGMVFDRVVVSPISFFITPVVIFIINKCGFESFFERRRKEEENAMRDLELVSRELQIKEVPFDMLNKETILIIMRMLENQDGSLYEMWERGFLQYMERTIGLADQALVSFISCCFTVKGAVQTAVVVDLFEKAMRGIGLMEELNTCSFRPTGGKLLQFLVCTFLLKVCFQTATILWDPKKAKPLYAESQ
jgi:hypothetical protein